MTMTEFWEKHPYFVPMVLIAFPIMMMVFFKYFKAETKSTFEGAKRFLLFLAKALGIFLAVQLFAKAIFDVNLKSLRDAGAIIGILNDPSSLTSEVQNQLVVLGIAAILIILMVMRVNIFTVSTDFAARIAKLGIKTVLILLGFAVMIVLALQYGIFSPRKISEKIVESHGAKIEYEKGVANLEKERAADEEASHREVEKTEALKKLPIWDENFNAEKALEIAKLYLKIMLTDVKTGQIVKEANETSGDSHPFQLRFMTQSDHLYDYDGNVIGELPEYQEMRVIVDKKHVPPGFSESVYLASILESDGTERKGYIRSSLKSKTSLEEFRRSIGHHGQWEDVPGNGSDILFQKVVNLAPGEVSQPLTYIITERIDYHFYRPDLSVQFTAWMNGQEVNFGPSDQKLPPINDNLVIRVRLSPNNIGVKTIRFVVTKR